MNRKLKILQLTHSYLPEETGMSEVVRRISEGLARRGHEVHVATSYCRDRHESVINGVRVWPFRIAGNCVKGYDAPAGETERFRHFVREGAWDVQANHHNQIWCIDLLLDLIPDFPWAKVYTPHGLPSWKVPEWAPYYKTLVDTFRSFDAITCQSVAFEEKAFCDQHGIAHVYIIPNGIDPAEFEQPPLDLRGSWAIGRRPWVLNVSSHSPVKGHRYLFKLGQMLPKDNVVLNIGNSYLAQKWGVGRRFGVKGGCFYKCRGRSLFGRNVQFRQHMPRRAVVSALRQADLFVLTSTRETSPLVILESMAAGLPWVAFDVGIVHEHPGGVTVRSLDEMYKWVTKLLAEPDLRSQLGAAGRQTAFAHHSWGKVIDSYEQLYYSILDGKPISRSPRLTVPTS